MQGSLIYTHPCGNSYEIQKYLDVSLAKQCSMWRYRLCDSQVDWSSGWHRAEDAVSAIDDLCFDLLPREGEPEPAWFSCAIVMHDKSYGGPEEGGWWYDTFEPQMGPDVPMPAIFKTRAEAEHWCDEQTEWCVEQNQDRHSPGSTISDGHYTTMIYEAEFPCHEPKEVPHYE